MDLQTLWFILIAILFLGYFVLEGFDFGVGMLLPFLGRGEGREERARRRDAAVQTIGPVWDGNEVWLITAGGALFAAFPEWYATMFSGFCLPLLLILLALIIRGVALEWRTKVDTPRWRIYSDVGIGIGSWGPALLWGVASRSMPPARSRRVSTASSSCSPPSDCLAAWRSSRSSPCMRRRSSGSRPPAPLRDDAHRLGRIIAAPAILIVGGFALWLQLAHDRPLTWIAVAVALACLLAAVILLIRGHDGPAFGATFVAILGLGSLIFGAMFPYLMPTTLADGVSLDIWNSSSSDYTLTIMSWAALVLVPVVLVAQGWTYWSFHQRVRA